MVKADSSVTINQPITTVFDWVVGYYVQNVQKWQPSVQQIQQTSAGPIGVGTTFSQVRMIQGKSVASNSQVVELQPPYRFVIHSQGQEQRVIATFAFQPAGPTATQMSVELDLEGGFPRMAAPMVGRQIKKDTEEDLNRLKSLLGG